MSDVQGRSEAGGPMSDVGGGGLEPGLVGDPHVTITHETFHLAVQAPCEQTNWQADRHVWKYYLPASPLAGGKL